jgi:hypothetical protein
MEKIMTNCDATYTAVSMTLGAVSTNKKAHAATQSTPKTK